MKKSIITIGLLYLSIGTTMQAQEISPIFHRIEFGARFMPTLSSFNLQTSSGGTQKGEATFGFGAGASLGFNITHHVGVQGEIIYNSLSQKYKDQNLDREINVRYVNIPLMLSLNTGKSRPVNLNVVFGPQLGVNVGSSISGSGSSSDTLKTVFAVKKNDFGFAYGAGLEFALNTLRTLRLDLGFRGVYGFVNISNTDQVASNNSYYAINRANVRTKSAYAGLTFCF